MGFKFAKREFSLEDEDGLCGCLHSKREGELACFQVAYLCSFKGIFMAVALLVVFFTYSGYLKNSTSLEEVSDLKEKRFMSTITVDR